ncbi:GNAT family N-acetyltransferase [Ferruginibacter sp. SUN002]|uniref:GNAT family N-acetyltransferase n=1 Tax=Ferruginibacter sp. SUN002 TaxID=2937789 RepID=UPI003D36B12D
MNIQHIPYKEIDKDKWDKCIDNADNGSIYAYSFYLDAMSKNWDALVLNDYEIVMPLTWNKKYGFYYLYQPFFCASLGVFGNNISKETLEAFLNAIPKKFKLWDIYLNHKNNHTLDNFNLYQRRNFILPLNDAYENIYNNFRENIKRNIKKATGLNCSVRREIGIDDIIALAKDQSKTFSPIAADDFERFKKLYAILKDRQKTANYAVYLPSGELAASAVFLFSHNRAYYILVGNHPNGKTVGASHVLIDAFIKDHSNNNIVLDFEGSDVQNLAFFYSGFGAKEELYTGIKLNRLPFWVRWFKK